MSDNQFKLEPTPSHVDQPKPSTCGGCGRMIVWGYNRETLKKIPLDPSAPVYRLAHDPDTCELHVVRLPDAMVSHFSTCPKANDFSGSRRKA